MTVIAPPPLRLATAAMGTRFELVLYGIDDVQLRSAGECALAEIERLHSQLTRFTGDSLLTHINRSAGNAPVRLDADTFALFQDAQTVYRESAGAFDCALGTGMDRVLLDPDACSIAFSNHGTGIEDRGSRIVDEGSRIKDQDLLFFNPLKAERVQGLSEKPRSPIPDPRSLIPHPILDLGAIAKGHALDCAGRILRDNGVESALLHGGTSSVLAIGAPPDETGWRIALAHHPQRQIIELCDNALSVSCTLGDRTHTVGHILDPRDHGPGVMPRSISEERYSAVVGLSARLADAWSTALIVLGQRPATLSAEWQSWLW